MYKFPIISIIVPVYNAEKHLDKCINSILNQTFRDFELILVNDGSTDNSKVICENYSRKDKRVKVISKKNEGVSIARNKGIDVARGKYIMFADSDDWINRDMMENMFKGIQSVDLVVCGTNIISNEKVETSNLVNKLALDKKSTGQCIKYIIDEVQHRCVWNKIYKTQIIKDNNLKFFDDVKCGEDSIFNFMYFEKINSIKVISEAYYNYNRIVEDSINLRYLPDRVKYENLMLNHLISMLKQFNIYQDNEVLLNNYQFEGIFMSLSSINHKECKMNIYRRYKFIYEMIHKFNFYDIGMKFSNISKFGTVTKFFILSKNTLLITLFSEILRIRQNKISKY